VTKQQAREDLLAALSEYDEGRITRAALAETVERTVEALYNQGYTDGQDADDIEFDSDFDQDAFDEGEPLDDDDDDDGNPDDFMRET